MLPARLFAAAASVVVVVVSLACAATASAQTTSFSGTYGAERSTWWGVHDCTASAAFTGSAPASGTGHPVFIYLAGSGEPYDGPVSRVFTSRMAARGFVSASVAYSDWQFYAAGIDGNARCAFGSGARGALSQLCARPESNCSKGVVVAGFSQGAAIAMRAANHDSRVRAAYLLGYDEERTSPWEGTARWAIAIVPPGGTRLLPNGRIRIVDSEWDAPSDRRDELNDQSGRSCSVWATSCLAPDGSGWYVVRGAELADGSPDHCYFWGGGWCPANPPFDPTWLSSTVAPWALGPNLDWLSSFASR